MIPLPLREGLGEGLIGDLPPPPILPHRGGGTIRNYLRRYVYYISQII